MDIVTYALSKKYTEKSLKGVGALKGAPCTIKSTQAVTDGTQIVFEWTDNSGNTQTSSIVIRDGADGKDGNDGANGINGTNGADGNGIQSITKIGTLNNVDTYRITFINGSIFDYNVSNGLDGIQGVQGLKGDQGSQGVQGIQGLKGDKGDDGYPFLIYKEYDDISKFDVSDFPEIGLMFMLTSDPSGDFPVYRYTGDISSPYSYVTSLSGSQSIKGDKGDKGDQGVQGVQGADGRDGITYTPTIGTVISGTSANVDVTIDNTTSTATFNFVLPKGDKGNNGANGNDGITPQIDPITKHWFIGETDTGIFAEGTNGNDGATPYIGSNGNWFVEDTDTGVKAQGEDGKSIKSITKDENNNIIVTFSDNTTQNIGQLNIDVQADFLTSEGFGNLRYYNGHLQYLDSATSTWVDTSITPDNVYIMNMMPQPMKKIMGVYDTEIGKYKLEWEEPSDTIIDGQVACVVDKVIIRRKLGSVPVDETDGDLVIEIKRNEFGRYKNSFYIDTTLSANIDDIYYYKAFPVSTTGFYNTSTLNETVGIKCKDYNLYGFKLDQNESDPASMITYLSDCDNAICKSAYMNYSTDTFNYGDWGDAWFIKKLKPCMLKYDGTVDYELDKNDYTKKADGTDSDVANTSYGGNAMIGFPKVYWKIVDNGDNTANIYICDKKLDNDFHCWSHIDNNGNEINCCYMPIYTGSLVGSTLRSLSDLAPMASKTRQAEINYAKANNTGSDIIWYTEVFSDRKLLELLLLLIGKSTDTQTVFGTGNCNSFVSTSNTGVKKSGTMNDKGLFWGSNDNISGVKVFGMEHSWGNTWRAVGGCINDKGTQKIKMTYGQSDGSTTDGYNIDGAGYISIGGATPIGTSGGYISKMLITDNGLIPTIASGSATTYYCDGLQFNNSQVDYAVVGGDSGNASRVGALCSSLVSASSRATWSVGASLSCKLPAKVIGGIEI